MGTGIGEEIYVIVGIISFNLIFSGVPPIGSELTTVELNGTTYIGNDGIFPQHTLRTSGCVIPNLFNAEQVQFNLTRFTPEMNKCPNSENPLLNYSKRHIWVVHSNLHHFNATYDELFRCCYKSFHLAVNDFESAQDEEHSIQYNDCILFNDTISIEHEFVRVFCYYNISIIYNQLFAFAQASTIKETVPEKDLNVPNPIEFNVILLGMSLISRGNFYRSMPKIIDVLKDKDTVDFLGYNRHANTKLDNILPALLGKSRKEINKNCNFKGGNSTEDKKYCHFIWERFKQRGYYTALLEDATHNSISSHLDGIPTDFYFNPLVIESDQEDKQEHLNFCTGDKYTYKIMLEYIEELCNNLQNSKLFGLFWQSSLNPIAIDSDYEMMLRNLDENGYLNRTILVILSDSGLSYGSQKEKYLEERLPLLKVVLPPSFRLRYKLAYNNFRINSERLVTTFDLHATLKDLADLDRIRDEEILIRNNMNYASHQAISLFVAIPENRTCSMAHLADDQCTCYKEETLKDLTALTAEYTSELVIPKINKIIKPYPQCHSLTLKRLLGFKKFTAVYMKENRWIEYMVRVQASPEGIFEAVLRYYDGAWSFAALINRLDYNVLKSNCTDDPFVKIYCICRSVMLRILPLPLLKIT